MDVHIVPGVKAQAVAEAHNKDLFHQHEHGCTCMTYWIDEQRDSIFCLIEAPSKEAVVNLHNQAHGLTPNKVIEVDANLVETFLGRIYDPADAKVNDEGLKVFAEPSFRIMVVTQIKDPVLLKNQLGTAKTEQLLSSYNDMIRQHIRRFGARETEHAGSEFIISCSSASGAVACALDLLFQFQDPAWEQLDFRVGIASGEPVEKSNDLFGDAIALAHRLGSIARKARVMVSHEVKGLVAKEQFNGRASQVAALSLQDESLLTALHQALGKYWQDPEFDMDDYCREMAMSKSQLYRKTISVTGVSPNILLKDFRLDKARELMRKQPYSISQITFETGFTSPSYFTKCFKGKFGILPLSYLNLLQQ